MAHLGAGGVEGVNAGQVGPAWVGIVVEQERDEGARVADKAAAQDSMQRGLAGGIPRIRICTGG